MVGLLLLFIGVVVQILAGKEIGWKIYIYGKSEKLVTKGIYSLIRHPIYVSDFTIGLGAFVFSGFILIGILTFAAVFFHIFQITSEELELSKNFGKEYEEYKKRTKKIIPFLY